MREGKKNKTRRPVNNWEIFLDVGELLGMTLPFGF